jgi:entericidin B
LPKSCAIQRAKGSGTALLAKEWRPIEHFLVSRVVVSMQCAGTIFSFLGAAPLIHEAFLRRPPIAIWRAPMTHISTKIVIALTAALFLTSCANTIRGAGRDVANTADATEKAAKDVAN